MRLLSALRWAACAALVVGILAACSPTYDWRTVADARAGYQIDLPAKPSVDERAVEIAGMPMRMQMRTADVRGAVFAIGIVTLPSDDPRLQRAVLDYLRTGLARNLGVAADAHAAPIPLMAGGQISGLELDLSGRAGVQSERRTIHARLAARGRHVYQAAIVAQHAPPRDQSDQFFESFKLY